VPLDALLPLDDALSPLWNLARYYSLPSLLLLAQADARAADVGADAVAVAAGVTPETLLARGARRVGVPVALGSAPPPLPAGGFYLTAEELPPDADVDAVRALVAAATAAA
jgi:hypothetical protein